MDILPVSFRILSLCGVWNEREYDNLLARLLYFFYGSAVRILIHYLLVFDLIELVLSRNDLENVTDSFFISLTIIGLCLKLENFMIRKKELIKLLNVFRTDLCRPKGLLEKEIIAKYTDKANRYTLSFITLAQSTAILMVITPLTRLRSGEKLLPIKMYIPYSTDSLVSYIATYFHHFVSLVYGINLNISFDSIVYGCMILACGQIELLSHRLENIYKDAKWDDDDKARIKRNILLRSCIRHHLLIHELVDRTQSLFMWTISAQFSTSLIILCTNIFEMTKYPFFTNQFFVVSVYFGSMIFELFSYCWLGNELVLKSKSIVDAVYFSNWTSVPVSERQNLSIIMTISHKGLILSQSGTLTVVVDTFMWIIKTSYSAFNLLQQMSN